MVSRNEKSRNGSLPWWIIAGEVILLLGAGALGAMGIIKWIRESLEVGIPWMSFGVLMLLLFFGLISIEEKTR